MNGANKTGEKPFVLPQGMQGLDGSGNNLDNVDEANESVNNEFNNKVPGTKVPSSHLNRKAKELTKQPKSQTAVQDLNGAQQEQQSGSILDIAQQNFQEITGNSNRNKKETEKDDIHWIDAVQGQNDDTNSAGGVRLGVSQLNKGKWKFECGNSDHMSEGYIFLDNDGNVTNLGYSAKFMDFIKARYSDTNFRDSVLGIDPAIAVFDGSIDDIYDKEMRAFLTRKPISLGFSNKSRSYTGLAKKVSDAGRPNEMKHLVAIRNFFFKIAMWIAAKWRGDGNINSSVRSDAKGVCEDLNLYLGSGAHVRINNATLIPTYRDGNCTLWAILIAIYGEEFVRDNFEYCRNTLIPYLRHLVAKDLRLRANLSELNAQVNKMGVRYSDGAGVLGMKAEKSLKDMSQEIERNCGFGAAYIEPDRLGPVAQALGCDIAVITNNSSGRIMYLLTKDGDVKTNNNFDETDRKRFIAALQNGHAIYGSNGHMWGLNTSGGVQYVYPASQSFNTIKRGGVDSANNSNAKSQEDLMADVKDLD